VEKYILKSSQNIKISWQKTLKFVKKRNTSKIKNAPKPNI
jgi:hypothetical protein